MGILKIRDSAGNVHEILAIKGEDYVLTEADKQEIAGLVASKEAPTKVSQLENDVGYLTEEGLGDYAKKTDIPAVPANVSSFTNDAGYITQTYIDEGIANQVSALESSMQAVEGTQIPTLESLIEGCKENVHQLDEAVSGMNNLMSAFENAGYQTESQVNTLIANALSAASIAYVGSATPASDLGKDGDIYIVTE